MQIEFQENQAVLWCIESPVVLRNYLEELSNQIQNHEGNFILSEQEKVLELGKSIDLLLTPFAVDVNEKRCLNKIYAEFKEKAYDEVNYLRTKTLLDNILSYFFDMEQETDIDLIFDNDVDFGQLIKAVNLKIEPYDEDMLGKLGQYLKVMAELLQKKIIIFVNLSFYMEVSEIEELLKQASYLKLQVVLIEQREIELDFSCKKYIIDKDNCEIF